MPFRPNRPERAVISCTIYKPLRYTMTDNAVTYEFKAETRKLLDIVINSL